MKNCVVEQRIYLPLYSSLSGTFVIIYSLFIVNMFVSRSFLDTVICILLFSIDAAILFIALASVLVRLIILFIFVVTLDSFPSIVLETTFPDASIVVTSLTNLFVTLFLTKSQ